MDDNEQLTAEEQAALDGMRAGDNEPVVVEETPEPQEQVEAEPVEPQEPAAEGKQHTVPLSTFMEEKEQRKTLARELEQERKARQTLDERMNMLLQRMGQAQPQQPAQQTPQLPELDKDPIGHFDARMRAYEAHLAQVAQTLATQNQQSQQAQVVGTIQQRALAMEREFASQTPDYVNAVGFLAEARHKELAAAGYGDPAERQAVVAQEAFAMAARALQDGANPAARLYELAKIRGYGASPAAPAAPVQQPPAPEERIQQISRGQQQSRSLGSVRGTAPPPLTAQRVADMSQDEFEKFLSKASPEQLAAVF